MEKRKVSAVYVTFDGSPWLPWVSDSCFEFMMITGMTSTSIISVVRTDIILCTHVPHHASVFYKYYVISLQL